MTPLAMVYPASRQGSLPGAPGALAKDGNRREEAPLEVIAMLGPRGALRRDAGRLRKRSTAAMVAAR